MKDYQICLIGLGYVGLPLAVEFAKHFPVVGFDLKQSRIDELNSGHDSTLEVEDTNLQSVLISRQQFVSGISGAAKKSGLFITSGIEDIKNCNIYIVTVPTPVDKNNRPDLTPLVMASETVGKVISKGNIVIYESTVYPGCTEEDCIPVIERTSGMKYNVDFFAGYSPERINPGDKKHTVTTIKKVTSGSTHSIAADVDELYKRIITAGTHSAPSIRIAETAKVIENSQRDINIAFMNELSRICAHMGLDTTDVLEAAGTKWNFLNFRPGLVGGHCIGVDPYYMAQKAQEVGYHPEIILAGRRMNDSQGAWIATRVVKLLISRDLPVKNAKILMLGITFKENCPDVRNTKVVDVIEELQQFGCQVDLYDPWADPKEVNHEYGLDLLPIVENASPVTKTYDAIILAVAHEKFRDLDFTPRKKGCVIFDIKSFLPRNIVDARI
jgi:UDP-N-acetyl-D-glucosamine/UDP-N-acetyl-D-galactosamine dehydrogenase